MPHRNTFTRDVPLYTVLKAVLLGVQDCLCLDTVRLWSDVTYPLALRSACAGPEPTVRHATP